MDTTTLNKSSVINASNNKFGGVTGSIKVIMFPETDDGGGGGGSTKNGTTCSTLSALGVINTLLALVAVPKKLVVVNEPVLGL